MKFIFSYKIQFNKSKILELTKIYFLKLKIKNLLDYKYCIFKEHNDRDLKPENFIFHKEMLKQL